MMRPPRAKRAHSAGHCMPLSGAGQDGPDERLISYREDIIGQQPRTGDLSCHALTLRGELPCCLDTSHPRCGGTVRGSGRYSLLIVCASDGSCNARRPMMTELGYCTWAAESEPRVEIEFISVVWQKELF